MEHSNQVRGVLSCVCVHWCSYQDNISHDRHTNLGHAGDLAVSGDTGCGGLNVLQGRLLQGTGAARGACVSNAPTAYVCRALSSFTYVRLERQ